MSTLVPSCKECENGQDFSGEAKPSWDKTVGGVLTSVLNRYRLGHTSVLQDQPKVYTSWPAWCSMVQTKGSRAQCTVEPTRRPHNIEGRVLPPEEENH